MPYPDHEAVVATLALDIGALEPLDALDAIRVARETGQSPLNTLLENGLLNRKQLLSTIAEELNIPYVDLFAPDVGAVAAGDGFEHLNFDWFERLEAVPLVHENSILVASATPTSTSLADYCQVAFPDGYTLALADADHVRQVLLSTKTMRASENLDVGLEPDTAANVVVASTTRGPVLEWMDTTLTSAVAQGASDLHFELASDGSLLVRFRIDSELVSQPMLLRGREMEVISALMTRAGMDSANLLEPQDGSFSFPTGARRIDVRASMIKLVTGPKVVLRLLDPGNLRSLDTLGFQGMSLELLHRAISMPQGLIVTAGPTGSGKTTTLYAMVQELASPVRNIMTVENPIEYRLPYVSQIPVRADLGDRSVTFARALRTILRLDPDVILIGEVRDSETARVALDAALTGHLVLTTIHASSATGVFTRFIEMGVPPYLVSEALTLAISQRLVRRVHSCRQQIPTPEFQAATLSSFGLTAPQTVAEVVGCGSCGQRGYRGRVAVAELCAPDATMRRLVAERASLEDLQRAAYASPGYVPYQGELQGLLSAGETTTAEVVRSLSTGEL